MKKSIVLGGLILLAGSVAYAGGEAPGTREKLRAVYDRSVRYTDAIDFPQRVTGDVAKGRAQFGIASDGVTIDRSQAIFQGYSVISGTVTSNGTVCADCHNPRFNYMLPPLPLSANVDPDDPVVTGRNAEAQGDPRQAALFDQHGLIKQRAGRFNPVAPPTDPFRRIHTWRKTQTILNMGLTFGLLTDGRARHSIEQARGAVFAHTQDSDGRFDDLAPAPTVLTNIGAFQESVFDPPELVGLTDPSHPLHAALKEDPFYTVHPTTDLERKGQAVFEQNCMTCHNMPNVFGNLDHVNGTPPNFPPLYGHTFDVGVAQANRLGLDYREYDAATGGYSTITAPLVRVDGQIVNVAVVDDLGAAAATGRYEDLYRFKVPQLRRIKDLGPYFHDNSAATLEDVLDHFNSDAYNNSADGKKQPIHIYGDDREALLAFLRIL